MPNKGKSGHSSLPIAFISRLPDWVVQSVLPIAIHRLLHRFYPLARHYPLGPQQVLSSNDTLQISKTSKRRWPF